MKKLCVIVACAFMSQSVAQVAIADDDFYGTINSRPDGKAGTWAVGDRSVDVTDKTELDEDYGPLKVGVCAEVEMEGGVVEEIESELPTSAESSGAGVLPSRAAQRGAAADGQPATRLVRG